MGRRASQRLKMLFKDGEDFRRELCRKGMASAGGTAGLL